MKKINPADFIGRKFGRLTILEISALIPRLHGYIATVRCDCGKEKEVNFGHVKSGQVQSCGCLMIERIKATQTKHGHTVNDSATSEYSAWLNMIQRCTNPKVDQYPNYGGRGIKVCDQWLHSFDVFLADMGPKPSPKHSLDRSNTDLGYEPSNCRWATPKEQARNRRRSRRMTHAGETLTLIEWAERTGIHWSTILDRLRRGWTIERALTEPVKSK